MLKIRNGLNLKERRYYVYKCPLCDSMFARRKEDDNTDVESLPPHIQKAQERIKECDVCGCDDLILIRFGTNEQEYINTVRPCIEKEFGISNIEMIMKELYILGNEE